MHEPIGAEGLAEERLPRHEPDVNLGLEPALATALETLTEREREVIALRFGGDLSGREIAEITDLSLTERPADSVSVAAQAPGSARRDR